MNGRAIAIGQSTLHGGPGRSARESKRPWAGCLLALASATAFAGDESSRDIRSPVAPETHTIQSESGWRFSVTPYIWAAALSGKTSQFGLPTIDMDWSFSDVVDHLDFGIKVMAEARYGRYSLFSDWQYLDLSNEVGTPRGIVASQVRVAPEMFTGMIGAGYSILESDEGNLDLVGGIKVWHVDTDISFRGGFLDGISRSDGATWVDGLVGFRGNYSITPNVYLTGWGLVGAGQAKLDWDVAGGVGYQFNDRISALAAYRAAGVDYRHDGFVFDAVFKGPMIALKVRF